MSKSNEKKSKQLGVPYGTACNRLRKKIMFRLMQICGMDICYQCGEKIQNIDRLSIEHKVPWLDSEDPVGLFFNEENLAFSHLHCNCKESRGFKGKITSPCPSTASYRIGCRCDGCVKAMRRKEKREEAERRRRRRGIPKRIAKNEQQSQQLEPTATGTITRSSVV